MSGGKTEYAVLESNNSLSLARPYSGINRGRIVVRQSPKFGEDVYVTVDKGQILCRSYEPCTVRLKFDDAKPIAVSAIGPSDHSTTIVFLRSRARFLEGAKSARKILVELEFYQNGVQILEFHSSQSLKWAPKAAAKARKPGG